MVFYGRRVLDASIRRPIFAVDSNLHHVVVAFRIGDEVPHVFLPVVHCKQLLKFTISHGLRVERSQNVGLS